VTFQTLRWLDIVCAVAILAAGVLLFLVLPWSAKVWVAPVTAFAGLLNALLFMLLRRVRRGHSQPAARS
jgi:hypothetical protein